MSKSLLLKWNCHHSAVAEGVLSWLGLRQAFVAKRAATRQDDGGLDEVDKRFRKKNGKKARNIRAFMQCASSRAWPLCLQLAFASTPSGRRVLADGG